MNDIQQTEEQLIEKLAAIEHERWADWQKWLHSKLKPTAKGLELEQADFNRWERQISMPYADLLDSEKQSDRDQVMRYWPLLQAYTAKQVAAAREEGFTIAARYYGKESNAITFAAAVTKLANLNRRNER